MGVLRVLRVSSYGVSYPSDAGTYDHNRDISERSAWRDRGCSHGVYSSVSRQVFVGLDRVRAAPTLRRIL